MKWYGDKLLDKIVRVTDEGLYEAALEIADVAEAKAPRQTGELAESVYASSMVGSTYKHKPWWKKQKKNEPGVALAAAAAPHSHLLEFGTVKMAAKPFMRPALDETKLRAGVRAVARMRKGLK